MAYTTINKSTDYFNTVTYSGNASTQAITGVGFQPDWCWFKGRNFADDHVSIDAVRNTNKAVYPNSTGAETTQTHYFTSFDSDGYTLGNSGIMNGSSKTYTSWNWKAGTTSGLTTNGTTTITPTSYSFNSTAGFSILKYTGNGAAGAYVAHGLGTTPAMIIVKKTSGTAGWFVYHQKLQSTYNIYLNTTDAEFGGAYVYSPDATNFRLRDHNDVNQNGETYVAYCFAEKKGYSKFSAYTGNGNNDGAFVYTGFRPAFVVIKKTTGDGWQMFDNKRDPHNVAYHRIEADSNAGDYTGLSAGWVDMVSNGFKVRYNGGGVGSSGVSYIYWAFGQSLVGSNNIPCTAR